MRVGIVPLFTAIFVTLKLCGVIDWSWVWVLCPVWIPLGLFALVLVGAGTAAVVLAMIEASRK